MKRSRTASQLLHPFTQQHNPWAPALQLGNGSHYGLNISPAGGGGEVRPGEGPEEGPEEGAGEDAGAELQTPGAAEVCCLRPTPQY